MIYLQINHRKSEFYTKTPISYCKYNPDTSPVLLWLQGGPGGSSLFGLFNEHGPFKVKSDNTLEPRSTTWALTHNMIYIDNPVGTGMSSNLIITISHKTTLIDKIIYCY